jgi:hypothetical protein
VLITIQLLGNTPPADVWVLLLVNVEELVLSLLPSTRALYAKEQEPKPK